MTSTVQSPIRVLIVDDHPVVREGMAAILGTNSGIDVIGEAASGAEAVALTRDLKPDVVLLDLEMPGMDGVQALQRMRNLDPALRTIVFTAFDTDDRILAAVRAGAQGYLLKGAPREDLFAAIRIVHGGGSLLQPVVASKLLRNVSAAGAKQAMETLTSREQQVLDLLARGLQNKEIATELIISERTVKFHVSSILGKLGVGNRTEAVRVAVQRGLVEL
ncbi:MAG: response regulator [Anaerolineales bacterium]